MFPLAPALFQLPLAGQLGRMSSMKKPSCVWRRERTRTPLAKSGRARPVSGYGIMIGNVWSLILPLPAQLGPRARHPVPAHLSYMCMCFLDFQFMTWSNMKEGPESAGLLRCPDTRRRRAGVWRGRRPVNRFCRGTFRRRARCDEERRSAIRGRRRRSRHQRHGGLTHGLLVTRPQIAVLPGNFCAACFSIPGPRLLSVVDRES